MQIETTGIYAKLAADAETWAGTDITAEHRAEILSQFAAGAIGAPVESKAIRQLSSASPGGAFIAGRLGAQDYLIPRRFSRLWNFFTVEKKGTVQGNSQDDAIAAMLNGGHVLLTGGPGTGKSHTLRRFIAERAARNTLGRPVRMTVAAPTGKAAARFAATPVTEEILFECATIHRLLGIGADRSRARHNAQNPVGADVVIVDEISMVDLGLLAQLVSALPQHTQLILAGDLDQLPAVDGLPLDAFIRFIQEQRLIQHIALSSVHRFSETRASLYRQISAHGLSAISAATADMSLTELHGITELHRFVENYALETYLTKDAVALRKKLDSTPGDDADLIRSALEFCGRRIILTERREGPDGSIALNERMRQAITGPGKAGSRSLTPIVATQNNYRLGIFNGDSGILIEKNQILCAAFISAEGFFCRIPVSEFSGWEFAYALTIHKSQGSEYGEVFVVVDGKKPNPDNRLLYTAVTRSRADATILKLG